jgi:hypothetical protein
METATPANLAPTPMPYKLGLPVGQFYIQTTMQGSPGTKENPLALSWSEVNETVYLYGLTPGSGDQIWTFNNDGTLSPSAHSAQVLTCDSSGNLVLQAPQALPAPGQQFSYTQGSLTLTMNGKTAALSLASVVMSGSQVMMAGTVGASNAQWYLLPVQNIPNQACFYLQTQMPNSAGDNSSYVMTIPDNNTAAGTQIAIEPLVEGALNQLWFINSKGLYVSALDPSVALSTWPGGGLKVTVQPIATSGELQGWFLYPNGIMMAGTALANVYANVSGGGNAASGKLVISYEYQDASNALWSIVPYLPSGLWFTIGCTPAAGAGNKAFMTLAEDGSICTQPPLDQTGIPGGQASLVQLWKRTLSGNIISAMLPGMAITAANGSLTLSALVAGNPDQIFSWTNGQLLGPKNEHYVTGALANQGNVLVAQGTAGGLVSLSPSGTDGTQWTVAPHAMPFEESTTLCNLQAGLYLTLEDKAATGGGYLVNIGALSGSGQDPALAIWQYQYPGYIVNGANDSIVLSLELDSGSGPGSPVYNTNVVAYPRQPEIQLFQLWDISTEGLLVNRYNGQALTIPAPASTPAVPVAVITAAISGADRASYLAAYQIWDFAPGMALQTLLAQPAIAFPGWNSNSYEERAYYALSTVIGVPAGIRTQYSNLAAPMSSYQSMMAQYLLVNVYYNLSSGGTTVPGSELVMFSDLAELLNGEITAIVAVQSLFQQLTTLYLSLSEAQEMTLSELITACALPDGLKTPVIPPSPKKKKAWIGDLVEGLLYTGINLIAPGADSALLLPCIANLMAAGFATYEGSQQSGSSTSKYLQALQKTEQNLYNYGMSVADLEEVLLGQFESVGSVLGQIEALILSDPYKLRTVFEMTKSVGDMSSLYWPATMSSVEASAMLTTYTSGVLKTLIPANADFYISATMHTNYGNLQGPGWNGNFFMENGDGTENMYSCTVNSEVMNIVYASGTKSATFFRGLNGWNLPVKYQDVVTQGYNGSGTTLGAGIVISILNFTAVQLTLNLDLCAMMGADCSYSYQTADYNTVSLDIAPYGTQQFAGANMVMQYLADLHGAEPTFYPTGLMGSADGKGISVVVKNNNQAVLSAGISNTYDPGYSIPFGYRAITDAATYTINSLTYTAPFRGTLTQTTDSSGMSLVTITVSDI